MSALYKIKTYLILLVLLFISIKSKAQEVYVEIEQDEKINILLEKRKQLLTTGDLKTHFSIQVISGSLETARKILKDCKNKFPDIKSNIVYDEPYYKVRVGEYRNQLDADRSLLTISKEYSGAFVFKPKN